MKTLYILRHAKSGKKDDPSYHDFDRPLKKRGKRQALFMGERFKEDGIRPDLIIASPAQRTLTTAREIADQLSYPKEEIQEEGGIYLASFQELAKMVSEFSEDHQKIMMVGHNPGITNLTDHFTEAGISNLPTCALVAIGFEVDQWMEIIKGSGRILHFDHPKKYSEFQ